MPIWSGVSAGGRVRAMSPFPPIAELEERLHHAFVDSALLEVALTHRSFANEAGSPAHYERLEFLGDAVLGLATADWLFRRLAERTEGELSRFKATLVSEGSLARYAEQLGLGEHLRLGTGEERSGGRLKASLLADALEALFGAIYLDGGFEAVRPVVERYLEAASAWPEEDRPRDAKTALQEHAQGRGWELPQYTVIAERGPDHLKLFVVEVRLRGEVAGRGEGRSKKSAEQAAAAAALGAAETAATERADESGSDALSGG